MKLLIIAATAALAIAPAALAAPGGNGNGKGAAKAAAVRGAPGWTTSNGVSANTAGRTHPHGMPPGQAKKLNGGLAVGQMLPQSYPGYRTIDSYGRYELPAPPPGYEYVRVGDDAYQRQTSTGLISSIVQNLFR